MRRRHVVWVLLLLSMASAAALLPGAGQSRPPESDGSAYTWTGAATLTVDVKPWGGGYVRSDPYLIDCPMACIRSFDPGREVKLTATVTPGHTFKAWEGACAGQGNPCTIKVSGAMDVTAVLEGQYVPPAPPPAPAPAPPKPPVAVNPALTVQTSGLSATIAGTGLQPEQRGLARDRLVDSAGLVPAPRRDERSGRLVVGHLHRELRLRGTRYSGPVAFTVVGTDGGGASASGGGSMTCP